MGWTRLSVRHPHLGLLVSIEGTRFDYLVGGRNYLNVEYS